MEPRTSILSDLLLYCHCHILDFRMTFTNAAIQGEIDLNIHLCYISFDGRYPDADCNTSYSLANCKSNM